VGNQAGRRRAVLECEKPWIIVARRSGRAFCTGLNLDMLAAENLPDGCHAGGALAGLERLDRRATPTWCAQALAEGCDEGWFQKALDANTWVHQTH